MCTNGRKYLHCGFRLNALSRTKLNSSGEIVSPCFSLLVNWHNFDNDGLTWAQLLVFSKQIFVSIIRSCGIDISTKSSPEFAAGNAMIRLSKAYKYLMYMSLNSYVFSSICRMKFSVKGAMRLRSIFTSKLYALLSIDIHLQLEHTILFPFLCIEIMKHSFHFSGNCFSCQILVTSRCNFWCGVSLPYLRTSQGMQSLLRDLSQKYYHSFYCDTRTLITEISLKTICKNCLMLPTY